MTDIVRCGSLFLDDDGTARRCDVVAGHIGGHQKLLHPGRCNAQHGSWGCVKLDGHDGPHSDDGDEWEFPERIAERLKPPVPCGLLITWYGTGSDTCALRAGHRGLHSSGPGDYIGGRTTEDVLIEAFQRISELEGRLRELEPVTDTPTPELTVESVDRAMGVLERRITDRLSGIESLIRDVGAKVSQLRVTRG